MTDYSESYLKIQMLMKAYYSATIKCDYEKATEIAHELSEETIKLEFSTYAQVKQQWLS